ncbi:MAG: SAM-dependent methyltransferase [Proteobacteria bacterium]|nr:MAG: SAM-dependent methyltransferase [Pseudomonadota bacterium]PIE40074.1 MAG: SAM-dependent methyltransferase [Gammaproteobacteria bacterium]
MIAQFYENKIFPWALKLADRAFRRQREEVLSRASGRVLEIGVGSGISLPFYSTAVSELVGIEPSQALRDKCQDVEHGFHDSRLSIEHGDAQALTYPDESFDAVVAFLVFCTIPDPEAAAREVYRVLKPGGKLFFLEHVSAMTEGMGEGRHSALKIARLQERLNPFWKKISCGCNLNRDTGQLFLDQGFHFQDYQAYHHPGIIRFVAPVIQGCAFKPEV